MKRDQIRDEVNTTLKALGFKAKQYRWMGCECHIVIAGEFTAMRFPAGMTHRALNRQLGRLEGWCEMFERLRGSREAVTPVTGMDANGAGAHP